MKQREGARTKASKAAPAQEVQPLPKASSSRTRIYNPKEANRTIFHGTRAALRPGDLILPVSKLEDPTVVNTGTQKEKALYPSMMFPGISKPEIAYATEDIEDAKHFAAEAARYPWEAIASAYVYEVEPLAPTKIGKVPRNLPGVDRWEHRSTEGYRVIRTVLSKAPPQKRKYNRHQLEEIFYNSPWVVH